MSEKTKSILFEVVGRSKTEQVKQGQHKIIYRISLKSKDGHHRHTITDTDSALLQQYPFGSIISIAIGNNPQSTLSKSS
jgi:hypothetical protein